jgi:hypothetical protein
MGHNVARLFVMLVTAAIGNTAGLVAKAPGLPAYSEAAVLAETQGGFQLAAVGQVQAVAVSAEGFTVALAPGAVAMTAQGDGEGSGRHGSLRGHPSRVPLRESPENKAAYTRENESARVLAENGYSVEQNPPPRPNGTKPDYSINGEYYDCYAPTSPNPRNIAYNIEKQKIERGQANRIVLYLDDTPVTVDAMRNQLTAWPIPGLKEVIAIKGGRVVPLFP